MQLYRAYKLLLFYSQKSNALSKMIITINQSIYAWMEDECICTFKEICVYIYLRVIIRMSSKLQIVLSLTIFHTFKYTSIGSISKSFPTLSFSVYKMNLTLLDIT